MVSWFSLRSISPAHPAIYMFVYRRQPGDGDRFDLTVRKQLHPSRCHQFVQQLWRLSISLTAINEEWCRTLGLAGLGIDAAPPPHPRGPVPRRPPPSPDGLHPLCGPNSPFLAANNCRVPPMLHFCNVIGPYCPPVMGGGARALKNKSYCDVEQISQSLLADTHDGQRDCVTGPCVALKNEVSQLSCNQFTLFYFIWTLQILELTTQKNYRSPYSKSLFLVAQTICLIRIHLCLMIANNPNCCFV